jgi:hypothetical protein
MKIKTSTIMWLIGGFIWSWFMGITAVSLGLGSVFPAINRVAKPFVCPGGQMVINSQNYTISPVENVTTLTWYCVDNLSGAKTELNPFIINVYAGSFYGLLIFVAVLGILYFYWRWGSSKETEKVKRRVAWIQGTSIILVIVGVTLFNLMPLIRSLTPESTTIPDATATSLASTYEALTLGKVIDFSSTDKPLADWNGIPIMPQADAGQQVNDGAYEFRVPTEYGLDMEAIESYYKGKLKSLGWTLADSRWAGMKFTRDKSVLLVTIAPTNNIEPSAPSQIPLESWVVTLVFVP